MTNNIVSIIKNLDVYRKICGHEPVYSYEKSKEIRERFNLNGVESKCLLLKSSKNNYFVYNTIENKKLNLRKIEDFLDEEMEIASNDDLIRKTDYETGYIPPIGYDEDIVIIIDNDIFNYNKYVFTPGDPKLTVEVKTKDFDKIFDEIKNEVLFFN